MSLETNGPAAVETPSNGPQLWEKPWTIEEMRGNANNWSLAGDAGLLQHLQEFSHQMISRVHEIGKEVDGLLHDTKMTGVRVHNVFNDFIMLANTQFIENRVYDEDVSTEETTKDTNKEEQQDKTREQRETELIPKVSEALQLGIKVTEEAFETLDSNVVNSDSEDDDDTNYRVDPILEAKDPYLTRPLPYMIGSPNFMSDETVGLDEDSEEEEVGHGDLSESEAEKESSEYSSSESDSERERTDSKPKTRTRTETSGSESSGGDLFDVKKDKGSDESDVTEESDVSDEREEEEDDTKDAKIGGFANELASKLGIAPPAEDNAPAKEKHSESVSSHKAKKSKKEKEKDKSKTKRHEEDEDIFPTSVQEDDDPFFAPKGGLFSTSKGLFDDNEDEGGLFDDEEKKAEVPKKRAESGTKKKGRKKSEEAVPPPVSSSGGGGGLFDDEDEDDLFPSSADSKKDKPEKKTTPTAAPSAKSDLFMDDDDDDLFSSSKEKEKQEPEKKKKKEKKLPAGAVSMFGSGPNPLTAAIKKQRQDSDEEDVWSGEDKSRSSSMKSNTSSSSLKQVDKLKTEGRSSSKNSLFDDDADDDALFSTPSKPRADGKSKAKPTNSLFDEDEEEDLFTSTKSAAKKSTPQKKPVETKPRAGSLFDDEEDDDLFGVPTKPKESEKKKPVGGVSLFGGADVLKKRTDSEIKEPEKKPEPVKTQPTKTTLSLFDDDEGDLFGGTPAPPKEPQIQTKQRKKSKNLFEDDALLFGEEEQAPSVDIFGSPPKTSEKNEPDEDPAESVTQEKMATSPPRKKPIGGVSMFGGMDPMAALKSRKRSESSKGSDPGVKVEEDKPKVKVEEKTEVKVEEKTAPLSPPAADPLFGEDEDEDDLFGAPKIATKKPVKPESKSSLLTGSDEDDDMFSVPKPSKKNKEPITGDSEKKDDILSAPQSEPVKPKSKADSFLNEDEEDNLFSTKPPDVPKEPVKPPEVAEEPVKHKKPVGGVSMFGGFDPASALKKRQERNAPQKDSLFGDDKEDDLFAPKEKPKPPKIEPKPTVDQSEVSSPPKIEPKPIVDQSEVSSPPKIEPKPIVDQSEVSSPPKPTIDQSEVSSAPVVKKPPGAVSMFGGVDPFGANKKKEPQSAKETDNLPGSPTADEHKKPLSSSSPPKAAGKIGKLQMNLGINPAAMLPGATPPGEKLENEVVGFDKPAEAKTLQSANKNRAKIQTKRRPPSRHSRHFSPEPSIDSMSTSPPSMSTSPPSMSTSPPSMSTSPPVTLENDRVPQPTSDLFGNEDMFATSPPKPSAVTRKTTKREEELHTNDNSSKSEQRGDNKSAIDDDDDIFSSKSKSKSVTKSDDIFSKSSVTKKNDEDIFSTKPKVPKSTNFDDELFSAKTPVVKTTPKTQVLKDDDDDENIFAPKKKTKSKTKTIFDDDDDIFGSSSVIKDKTTSEVTVKDKEEDKKPKEREDIVSSLKSSKDDIPKSDNENVKTNSIKEEKQLPVENDDDIFASKTVKKKTKRAKTKDEDLFNDDTDIFADVPVAKPKEKKKKKTTAASKSIFKDDVDDIFADSSPAPKQKKEKTKKTTTATKDDIIDDPLA